MAPAFADHRHDYVNVSGTLTLGANSTIQVLENTTVSYAYGQVFNLFDWVSVSATGFDVPAGRYAGGTDFDIELPTIGSGYAWDTSAFLSHGILVVVPEPSRMLMLLCGLLFLFLRRRRGGAV